MQGLQHLIHQNAPESDILQYIHSQRNPARYLQYYRQNTDRASHMIHGTTLYFHIPDTIFQPLLKGHFYLEGSIKPIQEVTLETDHGSILSIGSLTKYWLPEHHSYIILGKSSGNHTIGFVCDSMPFNQLTPEQLEAIDEYSRRLIVPDGYLTGYRREYELPYGAAAWNHHVANESNISSDHDPIKMVLISNRS